MSIDEEAFDAIQGERGWTPYGQAQYREVIEAYEAAKESGSSCAPTQDDNVEVNQQPDECPPKCNRFVALNCEKFTDCCDRRHCRYELRCILECISLDTTHGAGQRNRERAKEAIRLLPQLTAMKREIVEQKGAPGTPPYSED